MIELSVAVKRLIANEGKTGTVESMATAYAFAIGLIPVADFPQWKIINATLPNDKLERIKKKAWRKYNSAVLDVEVAES